MDMGALSKEGGGRGDPYRRGLLLLQRRLEEVRQTVRQIHNETLLLLAAGEARPQTPAETARERELRRQAQWLRWEMEHPRRQFESIQSSWGSKGDGGRHD
jgi:hypothetical protein